MVRETPTGVGFVVAPCDLSVRTTRWARCCKLVEYRAQRCAWCAEAPGIQGIEDVGWGHSRRQINKCELHLNPGLAHPPGG